MAPRRPRKSAKARAATRAVVARAPRVDVTRAEFNRVVDTVNDNGEMINQHAEILRSVRHDHAIQLHRIGELQAELDRLKAIVERGKG